MGSTYTRTVPSLPEVANRVPSGLNRPQVSGEGPHFFSGRGVPELHRPIGPGGGRRTKRS